MNPAAKRQIDLWTDAAEDAASQAALAEVLGDDVAAAQWRDIEQHSYELAGRFLVAELEEGL